MDLIYPLDDLSRQFHEAAESFAQREIAPLAAEVDRTEHFPRELWPRLGDMGFHGVTVAEEFGGMGLGYLQHVLISEQISRASGSIGISYIAHSNLCMNQIQVNGNDAQRAKYLPKLASGAHVGALAMSEPGAGSDVVSMKTRAEIRGDRVILNGSKFWITNGAFADVFVIYAKTDPAAGKRGISAFIVERGTPGFRVAQVLDKLGMRGSGTCELVFEDCEIPLENMLGGLNEGVRVLMSGLDFERIVAASASLGLMQAAIDVAVPYARERQQFGQPIGAFQLIQGKVAEMSTLLGAARAYLYSVASMTGTGRPIRKEAASAIMFASESATKVALDAIQILGGNGYINDYPVGRILRDAKLYEIGAGTSEVRRMLIGREILGL